MSRGITFMAESIPSLLDDRKTQTRRVINPQPSGCKLDDPLDGKWLRKKFGGLLLPKIADLLMHCPYGKVGDRLWVKETWSQISVDGHNHGPILVHRAEWRDLDDATLAEDGIEKVRWKSPRFMPRWAARIWLEITGIRVQRIQDISEDDARAEGLDWASPEWFGEPAPERDEDPREVGYPRASASFARDNFERLWDFINAKRGFGWNMNCWVWAITFRRIKHELKHLSTSSN